MRRKLMVRLMAACCTIAMLGGLAACGDNVDPNQANAKPAPGGIAGDFAGAGASSQQAAVEAWIAGFTKKNPKAKISYNPTGSGAGVITFLTGATAWAGSDKPLSNEDVKASEKVCASGTAFDIPVYIAPIAIAFNLHGISDEGKHVNMSPSTVAKIFNGKITNWNDKELVRENPDLELPDLPITIVHRSDKSGTTLNFVEYLISTAKKDWPYEASENWPNELGQGAKGGTGVVSTIDQAQGTIGYADYSQVGGLGTVALKVGDGYSPITAEGSSKAVADSTLKEGLEGENRVVVDINHKTEEEGAYPLVLISYDIACPAYKDANTGVFAKAWLSYVTSKDGQQAAERATGSAPLPKDLTDKIQESIDAMGAEGK